ELTDRLEEAMARIDQLTVLAQQLATGNERLSRVFTAEADGAVWPGRHRRTPKQLTGPGRPATG
ncbi:MAG: hypothetical protein FWD80_05425, partial [Propionibacteriaceae bacterium]|nr:hypothetical protein [Propionibacteriaceae bacterium]